jgi:hypothetical protein
MPEMTAELSARLILRQSSNRLAPRLALVICLIVVLLIAGTYGAGRVQADVISTPGVLVPTPGQLDPTNLSASQPIPAVVAAVAATKANAPLPSPIVSGPAPGQPWPGIPTNCEPVFGPGVSPSSICRLGDPSAQPVVALVGDSHAGMWGAALAEDASEQHFAFVPLDKPGCLLYDLHTNWPGWPCASWYRWALAQDRQLHPVATIVSFELTPQVQTHPWQTIRQLLTVLATVQHAVLIVDPPGQSQLPPTCVATPGATMGRCASTVLPTYAPLMHDIATTMTAAGYPTIPTLQWFCAAGVCPMVINDTLTLRDTSHMEPEYSAELAPLLNRELYPILTRLERPQPCLGVAEICLG